MTVGRPSAKILALARELALSIWLEEAGIERKAILAAPTAEN
jgi:hypothetical protein